MNEDKAAYVRKRHLRHRLIRDKASHLSKEKRESNRNDQKTQDVGIQYNWRRDNVMYCTHDNRSSSSTDIKEGNLKVFPKQNVHRTHLPETRDRGAGSADLTDYIDKITFLNDNGKAVVLDYVKFVGNDKLPINYTECGTAIQKEPICTTILTNAEINTNVVLKTQTTVTNLARTDDLSGVKGTNKMMEASKPSSFERQSGQTELKTEATATVDMSQGDTRGIMPEDENQSKTENTSQVTETLLVKINNKPMKSKNRKQFFKKSTVNKTDSSITENQLPPVKTSSIFRERFEALRRSFGKKDSQKSSTKSIYFVEVTKSKVENQSCKENCRNASKILESMPGKKVHFNDLPTEINSPISEEKSVTEESVENEESKKLFSSKNYTLKNKEKYKEAFKQNDGETTRQYKAHALSVTFDGDVNSTTTVSNKKLVEENHAVSIDEIKRKAWLMKCLDENKESKYSVTVRWDNKKYNTSSSTVLKLVENIYKESGIIVPSKSDIMMDKSSYHYSFPSPKVTFPQKFQTWTIPATISDQQPLMMLDKRRSSNGPSENIRISMSDQKWYIDKSKAFTHDIKVVLHSRNVVKHSNAHCNSEYLKIDIPKGFFNDKISNRDLQQVQTSEEKVYKIIEYENFKSSAEIKKGSDAGDHASKGIYLTVSVKDKLCETKVLDTIIKTPNQRDVVTQDSDVFVPKKCNVIGVGILTQRNIGDTQPKSILKILEYETDEDSSGNSIPKQCGYAESYLKDIYRNFAPLDIDLFSWCVGDPTISDCIKTNHTVNSCDRLSFNLAAAVYSDENCATHATCSTTSCATISAKLFKKKYRTKKNKGCNNKDCKNKKCKIKNKKNVPVNTYPRCENLAMLHKDSVYVSRKRLLYYNPNKAKWNATDTESKVGKSTESLERTTFLDKIYQDNNNSKRDDIDIHSSVVTNPNKKKKKLETFPKRLPSHGGPGILTYGPRHDIRCKTCGRQKSSKVTHMAIDVVDKGPGSKERSILKKHSHHENQTDCYSKSLVHPIMYSPSCGPSACKSSSVVYVKTKSRSKIFIASDPIPVSPIVSRCSDCFQTSQGPRFPCSGCDLPPQQSDDQSPTQSLEQSNYQSPELSSDRSAYQSPSVSSTYSLTVEKEDEEVPLEEEQYEEEIYDPEQSVQNSSSEESVKIVGKIESTILSINSVSNSSSQKQLQAKKKSNVTFDKSVTVLDDEMYGGTSVDNLIEINIRIRPTETDKLKETLQPAKTENTQQTNASIEKMLKEDVKKEDNVSKEDCKEEENGPHEIELKNIFNVGERKDLPTDGQTDGDDSSKDVNIIIFVKNLSPENKDNDGKCSCHKASDLSIFVMKPSPGDNIPDNKCSCHREGDLLRADQSKSVTLDVADTNTVKVNQSKSKIELNLPRADIEINSNMLKKAEFKMASSVKPQIKIVVPTKVVTKPVKNETSNGFIEPDSTIQKNDMILGQFSTERTEFYDQRNSDLNRITDKRTELDDETTRKLNGDCNSHETPISMNIGVSIDENDSLKQALAHQQFSLAKKKMMNTMKKLNKLIKSFQASHNNTPDKLVMACSNQVSKLYDSVEHDTFFKSSGNHNNYLMLNTLPLENESGFHYNYDSTNELNSKCNIQNSEHSLKYKKIDKDCNSSVNRLKAELFTNEPQERSDCNKSNKADKEIMCDCYEQPNFLQNKIFVDAETQICGHLKSTNTSAHGYRDILVPETANINISKSEKAATKVGIKNITKVIDPDDRLTFKYPDMKTFAPRTSTKEKTNTRSDITDDEILVCLETNLRKVSTIPKCKYKYRKMYKQEHDRIKEPADTLQLYETKKAVLEIYSEKNDDERVVAKLPKFMFDGEIEIGNSYERVTKNSCRKVKKVS